VPDGDSILGDLTLKRHRAQSYITPGCTNQNQFNIRLISSTSNDFCY